MRTAVIGLPFQYPVYHPCHYKSPRYSWNTHSFFLILSQKLAGKNVSVVLRLVTLSTNGYRWMLEKLSSFYKHNKVIHEQIMFKTSESERKQKTGTDKKYTIN